jgi:putative oxidoreductase
MNNGQLNNAAMLFARILLSAIFVQSGFNKIAGYAATSGYMDAAGVPSILLPLVILVELGGGLMILVGFQTRIAAIALAGFTLIAAVLFHYKTGDRNQMIHFMKNVSIAGGALALFVAGAGAWSLDALLGRQRIVRQA